MELKYKRIAGVCVGWVACPAVYEQIAGCAAAMCPTVHQSETGDYLIIGKTVSKKYLEENGLAGKVGEGESAVEIPKGLIKELISKI